MRRFTIHLCVALITFGVGLFAWYLNPLRGEIRHSHNCRKDAWAFNRTGNGFVQVEPGGGGGCSHFRRYMTPACPLLVKVSRNKQSADSTAGFEYYSIEITNLTKKTVRSYSLGFTCDTCRRPGAGSGDGSPYCWCSIPVLNAQIAPGELQTTPLPAGGFHDSGRRVWLDWIDFEDGSNWQPNHPQPEEYVRQ